MIVNVFVAQPSEMDKLAQETEKLDRMLIICFGYSIVVYIYLCMWEYEVLLFCDLITLHLTKVFDNKRYYI